MLRVGIYKLISRRETGNLRLRWYNIFISIVAVISIVPMMFHNTTPLLDRIDLITVYILFLDYILRWMTADMGSEKFKGKKLAFVLYPVTPYAIMDLVSLLPSLGLLGNSWRILRLLRIVKILHYSKNFKYIMNVIKGERERLVSVLAIATGYIFISALVMFAYEPQTFDNFFEALYWATTALTTVGYGDVYPVTMVGRAISMISSIFGIAVIALPAGIITGGFLEELSKKNGEGEE